MLERDRPQGGAGTLGHISRFRIADLGHISESSKTQLIGHLG